MPEFTRRFVHLDDSDRSLSVREDRAPLPGADEVLIEVHAAGINRADLLQRKGLYPPPRDASPIMGLEVSGTVVACGEAVSHWAPGDPVCALTHGGGYASFAVAPQGQCLPVPAGHTLEEAAALPEALLTIWHNVFQRARLRRGETILLHGGASGIGTIGVALCNAMGATVYSTAGTEEKCRAVERLGATRCFNYRSEDFATGLEALGLKDGVNVVFDMVGGDFIQKNLTVAAVDGRIVNIAYLRGFSTEVNFAPLLMKRLTMSGSTLRMQSPAQKAQMVDEIRKHAYEHLTRGAVKGIIDSSFALQEADAGQARMESGEHLGKILLKP